MLARIVLFVCTVRSLLSRKYPLPLVKIGKKTKHLSRLSATNRSLGPSERRAIGGESREVENHAEVDFTNVTTMPHNVTICDAWLTTTALLVGTRALMLMLVIGGTRALMTL